MVMVVVAVGPTCGREDAPLKSESRAFDVRLLFIRLYMYSRLRQAACGLCVALLRDCFLRFLSFRDIYKHGTRQYGEAAC